MKTLSRILVGCLLGLIVASNSASACGPARYPAAPFRVTPPNFPFPPQMGIPPSPNPRTAPAPAPAPAPAMLPAPNSQGLNETVINDLPNEAKRSIKAAAAKARANTLVRQVSDPNVRNTR